jgi:WD40 repeat protein
MCRLGIGVLSLLVGVTAANADQAARPSSAVAGTQKLVDAQGDPLPSGAVLRLGTLRWRAGSMVVFSAERGRSLVTVSQDYVAQIWDLASGKELRRLDLSGGPDKAPYQRYLNHLRPGVGLSADGQTLACFDKEGRVRVWDLSSGKEISRLAATGPVPVHFDLARDAKTLLSFSHNQGYTLWDVAKGTSLRQFGKEIGSNFQPTRLELDSTGQKVSTLGYLHDNAGVRSCLQVWDVAKGRMIRQKDDLPSALGPVYLHLTAFSPDHRRLALPDVGSIHLIDLEDDKQTRRLEMKGDVFQARMVFSADGKSVMQFFGHREALTVWDVGTGKVRRQFGKVKPPAPGARPLSPFPWALSVSADSKTLAWAEGPAIFRMDIETGKLLSGDGGSTAPLRSAFFSQDGRTVVTRGGDLSLRRWDASTGQDLGEIPFPRESFTFGVLSANGKWLVGGQVKNPIRVIEAATAKEQLVIPAAAQGQSVTVAISPDSRVLAVATRPDDNDVRLYDIEASKQLRTLPFSPPPPDPKRSLPRTARRLLFSPDSQLVAVGDTCVTVWSIADGRALRQIDLPPTALLRHAALSPDHRTVAIEMFGGDLAIWELAMGTRRFQLHSSPVQSTESQAAYQRAVAEGTSFPMSLAFSPDGRLLAQAAEDRQIHIWDTRQGTLLGTLQGHRGPMASVGFSPDGQRLVSASADTTALVWELGPFREKLKAASGALTAEQLPDLWSSLTDKDAKQAYTAVLKLAGDPAKAVPFLHERHSPVARADPKLLARLIADLDSETFKVRERARKELANLGELALPALTDAVKSPSPEVRKRAEKLLANLQSGDLSGDRLQLLRALEVLELAATPEARRMLQALAGGAPGALATTQARAILRRLGL